MLTHMVSSREADAMPSVYSTDKYILFVSGNNIVSFSRDGDLLYKIVDEGRINSIAIINDINNDDYNEILIASQNFIQPSTKIINGRNGVTIKVIPFSLKTFLGDVPYPTSKIVKKDNRIFLSNFNAIYELQGHEVIKRIEVDGMIEDFDYMAGRIVIKKSQELISFDSDFKNPKKKILTSNEISFLGKNNIVIVDNVQSKIQILTPSFIQTNSFRTEEYPQVIFVGENKIVLGNFVTYSFSGTKEILGSVNGWYEKNGEFYFMQNDKLKKLTATGIEEIYNASIPSSIVLLVDEDYVIEYVKGRGQETSVSLYKNRQLIKIVSLPQPTKTQTIAEDDFLITNTWPFEWKYREYYGDLSSLPHIKPNYMLKRIVDLSDINNDGINEVLLEFSDAGSEELDVLNALAIIYPKTKIAYEINFIPTAEELVEMIQNITNKIAIINATINNKTNEIEAVDNDISKLDSEINALQSKLSIVNETEKEKIEKELKDKKEKKISLERKKDALLQETNQLQTEMNQLNSEKNQLQDPNFGRRMKIKAYVLLYGKIFLALENKMFTVSMRGERLQEIEFPPEIENILYLSAVDRNNDGKLDVVFASWNTIGVLDGVNYTLAWKKNFNETSFSSVFVIGNKIIATSQNKVMWFSPVDGASIKEESIASLSFIEKLDSIALFSYEGGILIPRENDVLKINFVSSMGLESSSFALYDCNNDNKKDLLFVGSSFTYGSSPLIICIDIGSGNILKKEEIKLRKMEELRHLKMAERETERIMLKKIELHGKKLVVEEKGGGVGEEFIESVTRISGNIVIDLQNTEIEFITQNPIYYSENKIYVNEKEVQGKKIISSPSNNQAFDGDFELIFSTSGAKIIYVDGEFYGFTDENKKVIKVTSGKHQIAVLNPSPQDGVVYVDFVYVNVNRKVSKIAYIITILMLIILVVGLIIKWKRLKR